MRLFTVSLAALSLVACSNDPTAEDAALTGSADLDGAAASRASVSRDVMIGKDGPDMDACGTLSSATADTEVRMGPDEFSAGKARLKAGQQVKVCETSEDGAWAGVVFHPSLPELPDCGTGSPVAQAQPYRGACSSGWVKADALEMLAG